MYRLWKRVAAYLIDILLVSLVASGLSNTTLLNPNLNQYQKYSKEYSNYIINYQKFLIKIEKYYEDKQLEETEYNNLIEKYPTYKETIDKYYQNNELTEKNYKKLIKEIDNNSLKRIKQYYFKIEKNSISEKIIYLVLILLYFVGFNVITEGQTFGKKIMGLKIVNIDNQNISIINYILRAIFIYQALYYAIKLVGILTLNSTNYYTLSTITSQIQSGLELVIFTMIIMRKDKRGLHDLIAKTKVIKQ